VNERDRRFAENEMMFRSVNENIEAVGEELLGESPEAKVWDFLCECHDVECGAHVPMTPPEYEAVRASGRRFVVAPSDEHVNTEVERVVDRSTRYWVVEKVGEAGEIAEESDPRDVT
jgi:hypothetical protein